MKKTIFFSFVINITGLLSIFVVDLLITKTDDSAVISSWALIKSTLFIGLIFVLVGLDQAIVRLRLNIKQIISPAILQFFIISAIVTVTVIFAKNDLQYALLFPALFFLATIYLFYAEHRLNLNYARAQLSANGWKIVFLVALLIVGHQYYLLLLPISIFIVFLFIFIDRGGFKLLQSINFDEYRRIVTTGAHYFVTLLTLTLTLYMDQIVLNFDSRIHESSTLFSHITFFISPNGILIGFGGFLLAPYLKRHPDKKKTLYDKYIVRFLFVISFFVAGSYLVGFQLYSFLRHGSQINIPLSLGLSFVAFLRYLYILPSAYVGSFASNKLIRQVASINLIGILLYIFVYYTVSRQSENYLIAILLAILSVWIVRIINEYSALYRIINNFDTNK